MPRCCFSTPPHLQRTALSHAAAEVDAAATRSTSSIPLSPLFVLCLLFGTVYALGMDGPFASVCFRHPLHRGAGVRPATDSLCVPANVVWLSMVWVWSGFGRLVWLVAHLIWGNPQIWWAQILYEYFIFKTISENPLYRNYRSNRKMIKCIVSEFLNNLNLYDIPL